MTGRLLLPLLLVAAACSSEIAAPGELTSSLSQPIVNGTPSTATDDSVVFIAINGSDDEFCTGTLIAPNLVITARHCVSAMDESTECGSFTTQSAPGTLSIALGVKHGPTVATATKIFVDTTKGTSGCSNDIALFQLDHDVASAKVSPVRFTALTVGETARTAGYGEDGSGRLTNGRYEKTGLTIDAVGPASYTYKTKKNRNIPVTVPPGEIVTGESTCFGDSGGPLFDSAGQVIGVTSRGVDEECRDRPSIYSDTASHEKLITDAAQAAGHPLGGAPSVPAAPDAGAPAPDAAKAPASAPASDAPAAPPAEPTETAQAAGCSAAPGGAPASPTMLVFAAALGMIGLRARRRGGR